MDMTILEIILLIIFWVGYGAFAAGRTDLFDTDNNELGGYVIFIVFAPIVLVFRALHGIFRDYRD